MNYGIVSATPVGLLAQDEPDRFCIELYERVIAKKALQGKNVLEVGSGRGGGASYVARYHKAAQTTGVDFSRDAVALARQLHGSVSNLEFDFGDAEDLPFPAGTFDAVINVESSHCYGNMAKFIGEVARVLRPGGNFLFADMREGASMSELERLLQSTAGLRLIEEEDITADVAAALEADDARKRALIKELVPPALGPMFLEFAGVRGGKVHASLTARTLLYKRFVLERCG